MTLVLLVTLLAVGVGLILGGQVAGIARLRLHNRELLGLALLVQVTAWVMGTVSGIGYAVGVTVTALLAGMFCVRNFTVPGVPLITAGLALNFLVVAANGAMPVSVPAAQRAGVDIAALLAGADPRHEAATERTALPWLGDVIPVALPWRPEVISVGDVLLAAGLALLVVVAMRAPRSAELVQDTGDGRMTGDRRDDAPEVRIISDRRTTPDRGAPDRDAPDRDAPDRREPPRRAAREEGTPDAVVKPVGAAIQDYPDPGGHVAVERATTRDNDSTTTGSYS